MTDQPHGYRGPLNSSFDKVFDAGSMKDRLLTSLTNAPYTAMTMMQSTVVSAAAAAITSQSFIFSLGLGRMASSPKLRVPRSAPCALFRAGHFPGDPFDLLNGRPVKQPRHSSGARLR
jgi:hypothetical protein